GPGGDTVARQTASARVSNLPAGLPGIEPPSVASSQAPTNVQVSLIGGYSISSYAGVGFRENLVAGLSGNLNRVPDPHAGDFHAFVNWGDSSQWFPADVAPNTGGAGPSFLVKAGHVYAQANQQYPVVVYAIGPDGTSVTSQTAGVRVSNLPA